MKNVRVNLRWQPSLTPGCRQYLSAKITEPDGTVREIDREPLPNLSQSQHVIVVRAGSSVRYQIHTLDGRDNVASSEPFEFVADGKTPPILAVDLGAELLSDDEQTLPISGKILSKPEPKPELKSEPKVEAKTEPVKPAAKSDVKVDKKSDSKAD